MAARNQFSTKLGVIAVTVGSAVGLGNIWRFPYEAGMNGGGAFLLINIFFVLIIGIPVICAEFYIGKTSQSSVCQAFNTFKKGKGWQIIGWMGLSAAVIILGFYSVVAGWTMEYIFQSLNGFGGDTSPDVLHTKFVEFAANDWQPLLWTLIFLTLNFLILIRGVEKGIEKMNNILMPTLFVILLAFTINSLLLPKAGEGLEFLFKPDFSEITPSVVLSALGQAFFSLSVGLGCLITYASYFKKETPIVRTASISALLDTLVAIMAGIIIFPAVFTYGQEPAAGPQLVFEVLPSIFMNMPGGIIWSVLFFILLFVASLTSTLSLFETTVSFLVDKNISRTKGVIMTMIVIMILAVLCSLSFGALGEFKIFGLNFFDLSDFLGSNILLPLGGLLTSIFTGYILDRKVVEKGLLGTSKNTLLRTTVKCIIFSLKFIAPLGIALVFIFGLHLF